MGVERPLGDGEADAGPGQRLIRVGRAVERLEEARQVIRRDADAGVPDDDDRVSGVRLVSQADGDGAVLLRVASASFEDSAEMFSISWLSFAVLRSTACSIVLASGGSSPPTPSLIISRYPGIDASGVLS